MGTPLQTRSLLGLPFLLLLTGCVTEQTPDHTNVPGIVIAHAPASSGVYLGSPGIAALPGGEYVASLDYFGPSTDMTTNAVYRSTDRGETWTKLTEVVGQFWSTIFFHDGSLYLLGTSRRYGAVVIRRSTDGGATWTTPNDAVSGLLIDDSMYHCAPVPVLVHEGRLWKGFEKQTGEWPSGFRPFVLSAPVDADLLLAKSWTVSQSLPWDDWKPYGGWLEGNVVQTPDGGVVDILRVHEMKKGGKAAVVRLSDDGKNVSFDPVRDFISFPGGCKKFTIRHDPETGLYWSLTNWVHPDDEGGNVERTRNTVALISSEDLKEWSIRSVLLRSLDVEKTGFQYIDWLIEGEDIIAVSRTAFDDGLGGADNQHNANYITFHRFEKFRTLGK
jgi:hypothetical protein